MGFFFLSIQWCYSYPTVHLPCLFKNGSINIMPIWLFFFPMYITMQLTLCCQWIKMTDLFSSPEPIFQTSFHDQLSYSFCLFFSLSWTFFLKNKFTVSTKRIGIEEIPSTLFKEEIIVKKAKKPLKLEW